MAELDLARRLDRVESRAEIAEIVALYCRSCDDKDAPVLRSLFTDDAVVESKDGVMRSQGIDAIMTMYDGRFAALGVTAHWTHDHMVRFDDANPDLATGSLSGHAECYRNGRTLVASLRYDDEYRRVNGRWKFSRRILSFLYYVPVEEYGEALGSELRQRAYGDRRPADFPESIPGWKKGAA
ncbi:nuclear transport factor 2 family protein [uncultured Alsobacter sp.]|uniref:nuclear transport factor 2 family protein n=1 Tax=uncultured Alsobacter sp. TaxID=1748258 RepID=UPI0025FE74A7|nr:nuclear transport factor 2 family protein [uncultured Alsobacter sp.]